MARGKELSLNLDVLDAAEPPARVQHGSQSVVRMGGVRGDALGSGQAAFLPNVPDGGELFSPLPAQTFQSEASQAPHQTEMPLVSRLSIAPL